MVIEDNYNGNTQEKESISKKLSKGPLPLASPIDRLAANVVDVFLVLTPLLVFLCAPFRHGLLQSSLTDNNFNFFVSAFSLVVVAFVTVLLYHTVLVWMFGATLGKLFFGLRVIKVWRRGKPDFLSSLFRGFFWIVDTLLLCLPHLAVFSNIKRRTFHDRLSDTIVVSTKDVSAGRPNPAEVSFVRGTVAAFAIFFFFVFVANGIKFYSDLKSQTFLVDLLNEQGALCGVVSESHDQWPETNGKKPSRLSVAMALFAAEKISPSCLEAEADLSFIREEPEGLAYLANSFVYSDDGEKSNKYLEEVCNIEPESQSCMMSLIVNDWSEERWEEVDNRFSEIWKEADPYILVWATKHYINKSKFHLAIKALDKLGELKPLSAFIGREKSKVYWGEKRFDESRAVASVIYSNLDYFDRIDLASWLCFEEIDRNCSNTQNLSCRILSESVKESAEIMKDSKVALAYIKDKECQNSDDYQQYREYLYQEEAQLLLDSIESWKNSDFKRSRKSLLRIITNESFDVYFRNEAMRRYIDTTNSSKKLAAIFHNWQASEKSMEWEKTGRKLFMQYLQLGSYQEAYTVGQLLLPTNKKDEDVFKGLIVSSYNLGHHKRAWKLLGQFKREFKYDIFEGVKERGLASLNEFSQTIKKLNREFKRK